MASNSAPDDRAAPADAGSPLFSLIAAGLFLYVGFGLGLVGAAQPDKYPLYHASIVAFVWMARIVGIGLGLLALAEFAGLRGAALLDALLAGVAALVCAAVGAIWIAHSETQGWLLVIFALVNGAASRDAWRRSRTHAAPPHDADAGPLAP